MRNSISASFIKDINTKLFWHNAHVFCVHLIKLARHEPGLRFSVLARLSQQLLLISGPQSSGTTLFYSPNYVQNMCFMYVIMCNAI